MRNWEFHCFELAEHYVASSYNLFFFKEKLVQFQIIKKEQVVPAVI